MKTKQTQKPCYEEAYCRHLDHALKNYKRTVKADSTAQKIALLNLELLNAAEFLITGLMEHGHLAIGDKILDKHIGIKEIVRKDSLQKHLDKDDRDIAYGEFIEALNFYGLPYQKAYEIAADLSCLSTAAMRTAHEKHNNVFDKKGHKFSIIGQVSMGPYKQKIRQLMNDRTPALPQHPKAKEAWLKVKSLYSSD